MTQKQLSELTGIPQGHISEMENGKRAMGEKRQKQRGTGLNLGVSFFICLGNLWDSSAYKFISSRNEY